eukprot:197951_1
MVDRDIIQSRYYNKLITNIKQISPETFTFDINSIDEIFTFQRLPFHHSTVLDSYQYIIGVVLYKHVSSDVNINHPKAAIIGFKYTLCSLQSSHASFCKIKIFSSKLKPNKPGKKK